MSLEDEALRDAPVRAGRAAPARTFDRFVRSVATVLLLGVLTAVYWVPMQLLGGLASAIVLAALTMLGAGLASRLYHLRIRVQALESVLNGHDRPSPSPPMQVATQPSAVSATGTPTSKEIQEQS